MALSEFETALAEVHLDDYIVKMRPPAAVRDEVDLAYRIEDQSVVIFEVRPHWKDASRKIEEMVAKVTFVRKTRSWKIYWQRADLKWHRYEPDPEVGGLEQALEIIGQEASAAFWG